LTRIDHIGSTSVLGLAAKPVIDVQVSIRDFQPWRSVPAEPPEEPTEDPSTELIGEDPALIAALTACGLRWLGEWIVDYRKWFFRRRPPYAAGPLGPYDINVHIRREGCFSQQQALIFRDYLRGHVAARRQYEQVKRSLATQDWSSVDAYADAKTDCVWSTLRAADIWSRNGWRPGPSDA
jgi:GrpB-like predicted nucleotidyltransferase (UPF0157 family)